jgi:hypothetical protein
LNCSDDDKGASQVKGKFACRKNLHGLPWMTAAEMKSASNLIKFGAILIKRPTESQRIESIVMLTGDEWIIPASNMDNLFRKQILPANELVMALPME